MHPFLHTRKNAATVAGFFGLSPRRNKISLTFLGFMCALLLNISAEAQRTITTGIVSPTAWCASSGGAVSVPFTFSGFTGNRAFVAQLSDATGAFGSPTTLGTVTVNASTVSSATISGTVPAGLTVGSAYRIRVINVVFSVTGSLNSNGNLSIRAAPSQPGTITGNARVCSGSSNVYSVTNDANATSYTWTLPSGWTGTSTTNSITVTSSASGGNISVTANNACGPSVAQTKAISVDVGLPAQPGAPSGQQVDLCSGGQTTITVPAVSGATSYTWTLPAGTTHLSFASGQTTNSVTFNVVAGINHEQPTVTANNACGASTAKVVNLWGKPSRPIVSGPTCVPADSPNVAFHVTNVEAGVTYNWTPSGTIEYVSGQGTATYTVNWKHSNGNVTVSASNACATTGITRWVVTICASPVTNGIAVTSMPVHVFPNPASSSAQISFTANRETKYVIELADKTGNVLQRKELIAHAGENKITLDLGKYTNGAYFVNVVGEDRHQTAQIIKTN